MTKAEKTFIDDNKAFLIHYENLSESLKTLEKRNNNLCNLILLLNGVPSNAPSEYNIIFLFFFLIIIFF